MDHHQVEMVNDGLDALNRLKISIYDLVILDISMPGMEGLEVLKNFREAGGTASVLLLTGRNTIDDVEKGFDAGADDYLKKPFHGRELNARVKALLKRPTVVLGNVLPFAHIVLDRENYRVTSQGKEIALLPKEFTLLEFFMRHPNRVFSAEALLNRVWEADSDATEEAVTTCIKRLRQKIDVEGKPSLIRTMRGAGYKLEESQ